MQRIDLEILINRVAQGHVAAASAWEEVSGLSVGELRDAIRYVSALAQQAGMLESDVPEALLQSGVKRTRTAAVLVQKGQLGVQLARIVTLPPTELRDAWMISLAVLAIADTRRRTTSCKDGCGHWWHRDLSNPEVVRLIHEGII